MHPSRCATVTGKRGRQSLFRIVALVAAAVLLLSACTSSSPQGAAGSPTPKPANSVPGLPAAALTVMNKPAYAEGQWAIAVRDIDTGKTVISLNAGKLVEPASVTKTYSVGAAWLFFGPDHKVVTPVKRTGPVVGGTLDGDLVLVGEGDLTMDGRTKPDGTVDYTNLDHNDANKIPGATLTPEDPLTGLDHLAAQVRKAGITTVSGNVIVDDRLWAPHQLEDEPITPIDINNNLIDFTTTAGKPGQVAATVMRPKVAPWTVTGQVKTVAAGGKTKISVASPVHGKVVLSGTIAADSKPVVNTYAFSDPATFARTAFIEALGRAGVDVTANPVATNPDGSLPAKAAVAALPSVARLSSLSLQQEATYTLKVSYNRGAETMICLLAVAAGSTNCEDGLAKAAQVWRKAGLDTKGATLIDGSGLTGNLITPENEAQLQTIMAKQPHATAWRSALPILGVDGSLSLVQPHGPARGKVFAKTGSLGAADLFNDRIRLPSKSLGGYIETKKGRHFAFCIVASNAVFKDINGVFAANDDVGKVASIIQQAY